MNILQFIFLLLISYGLFSQSKELPSALPNRVLPCDEEVAYIFDTDQYDRLEYILDTLIFDFINFNKRDSIRLTRLIELDAKNCFGDYWETYYKAGFVYFHNGGIFMKDDSTYYKRVFELFKIAGDLCPDTLKKKGLYEWSSEAYNYYLLSINSSEARDIDYLCGTITDFSFFHESSKIDSMRSKLRSESKKQLSEKGITLPDSMIDEAVEKTLDLMRNLINSMLHNAIRKYKEQKK